MTKILLLDVDGVLVRPSGYRAALLRAGDVLVVTVDSLKSEQAVREVVNSAGRG
jgi:hypothetical protein